MSGLARFVRILRLFDETRGDWTVPDMAAALGQPPSTVYRLVREMVAAGFLEAANDAHYRLGCCFIEFDRVIRVTDPLYEAGMPLLREIVLQARVPCVAVLARLYGDTVMCVADAATPDRSVRTSYERGRPRPLTAGATSKAILTQLNARRLARLLAAAPAADVPAFAVPSAAELRDELAAVRKRGFCITHGEVDRGLVGIAAPVSLPASGVTGSLSLVVSAVNDAAVERRLAMLVVSTASLLEEQMTVAPALRRAVSEGRG